MKTIAIIQARMSSQRLPGKSLAMIAGRPMLQLLLERLGRCVSLDEIVIATSTDASDDAIVALCESRGIACHRGSLDNVAMRFRSVVRARPCDAFVRVNGDSPLLDPRLIDRGVGQFCAGDFDIVTNVHPRSFPRGQSVEVVRSSSFERACSLMSEPDDFEHVTRVFYRRADDFEIGSFRHARDCSGLQMSVDDPGDLDRIRRMVAGMSRPHGDYDVEGLVRLYHEDASRCLEAAL